MRLWHKDLISVLPLNQLLGQWRECCLIAKNISDIGTPNHILVNKVMDYPLRHFIFYTRLIKAELIKRGCDVNPKCFDKHFEGKEFILGNYPATYDALFYGWHTERYLMQCFYNLQEKYDCGGITEDEWLDIVELVNDERRF